MFINRPFVVSIATCALKGKLKHRRMGIIELTGLLRRYLLLLPPPVLDTIRGIMEVCLISSVTTYGRESQAMRRMRCRKVLFRCLPKLSWQQGHELECKLFTPDNIDRLHSIWPHGRLVLTILLRREHGLISDNTWTEILRLKSHVEKTKVLASENDSRFFKQLANSQESIATIQQLTCTVARNSYNMDAPFTIPPLGTVFDPAMALINHSREPNALYRCDVSPQYTEVTAPRPILGSVSVFATRDIAAKKEIFISYLDPVQETAERQSWLQGWYFFTCSCSLCSREKPHAPGTPS